MERQLRAAQGAVDQEEGAQKTEQRAAVPDAEHRERIELRGKASLGAFLTAAAKGRLPDGPEGELLAAAGVRAGQIPLELWDVGRPAEQRQVREDRATADVPGTVGVNLDPIRPAVFANAILPRLGVEMPRVDVRHLRDRHNQYVTICGGTRQERSGGRGSRRNHRDDRDSENAFPRALSSRWKTLRLSGRRISSPSLRENLSLALSG